MKSYTFIFAVAIVFVTLTSLPFIPIYSSSLFSFDTHSNPATPDVRVTFHSSFLTVFFWSWMFSMSYTTKLSYLQLFLDIFWLCNTQLPFGTTPLVTPR